MGKGRGSAMVGTVLLMCLLLIHTEMVDARIYTVGGVRGWTFNVVGWPRGIRFRTGDVLVFKYLPVAHNVVAVNRVGFHNCMTPRGSKFYKTGRDQIKLVKGMNYFICSFPGHCQAGMRIAINAI